MKCVVYVIDILTLSYNFCIVKWYIYSNWRTRWGLARLVVLAWCWLLPSIIRYLRIKTPLQDFVKWWKPWWWIGSSRKGRWPSQQTKITGSLLTHKPSNEINKIDISVYSNFISLAPTLTADLCLTAPCSSIIITVVSCTLLFCCAARSPSLSLQLKPRYQSILTTLTFCVYLIE